MPEHLVINRFEGGWAPSDDAINGRKNILLRMNNVELDKNGAIKLSKGCSVVQSGYPAEAHTLYSRVISLVRHDYAALTDGKVYRDATEIMSGGNTLNAAFGTAFNYTLILSGDQRKKDTGSGTPTNLGIVAPTIAPTFNLASPSETASIPLDSSTVNPVGSVMVNPLNDGYESKFIDFETSEIPGAAVLQTFNLPAAPLDWSTFPDSGTETPDDYMYLNIRLNGESDKIRGQLDILLQSPNAAGDPVANFYTVDLSNPGLAFAYPFGSGYYLKIKRSDFTRVGSGGQDWSTVYGFRISIYSSTTSGVLASAFQSSVSPNVLNFKGGSKTKTGTYEYAQMNVSNNGVYIAKSELGPIGGPVTFDVAKVTVNLQEPTDPQVNEIWLFRRGGEPDPNAYYPTIGLLDQWYRIGVILTGAFTDPWLDDVTDEDALTIGITVNTNLRSIAATSITERIIDLLGPIHGRWYYFSEKYMYPSDINDPDLVDVAQAIRTTGNTSEVFLWARQVNDAIILVGTSVDIYVLTGTFISLPDNSIDVFYRPLGVKYPPMTNDAVSYGGQVFYLSHDGWRTVSPDGTNTLLISPNIDRLYKGESCYSYDAIQMDFAPGSKRFPLAIAKNKLWCNVYGINHTEVYDFIRQYWRVVDYGIGNIVAATSTQDGRVLVFCGTDLKLREMDDRDTLLVDEATQQNVSLLFPVHDGGFPKRRKDNYTLKIRVYTGAAPSTLDVKLIDETETEYTIADNLSSPDRVTDFPFDIESILEICKTWQIKIEGQVSDLILEDVTIDYDLRPEQLSFLRILPTNYGTPSRKRVYEIPFQIDTLGNNVNFITGIDGNNQTTLVVNSSRKQTFAYKQPIVAGDHTDILRGVDYGFDIAAQSGLFEFHGFSATPKMEVLPEPIRAFVIPPTNFGNACKKRLRVWPFVLDTLGKPVTFLPIVDGAAITALQATYTNNTKETIRHHYTQDVFGVFYSGTFFSDFPFELYEVMPPDIVQTLPLARRFDQVGPEELFRYGRIKQFEYRVFPYGAAIPYIIYFNDNTTFNGTITTTPEREMSYFIGVPKGTNGTIVRVVFGPTAFDFHRFYIRLQVFKTGRDTELEWVTLPIGGLISG